MPNLVTLPFGVAHGHGWGPLKHFSVYFLTRQYLSVSENDLGRGGLLLRLNVLCVERSDSIAAKLYFKAYV